MSDINPVRPILKSFNSIGQIQITKVHKIVLLSVCASAALLGIVAQYLKRRKTNPGLFRHKRSVTQPRSAELPPLHSPEEGSIKGESPLRTLHRQASVVSSSTYSEKLSAAGLPVDLTQLTPQQLGVMGGASQKLERILNDTQYYKDIG